MGYSKEQNRAYVDNYKQSCKICGCSDKQKLTFHHRNPHSKRFTIAEGVRNRWPNTLKKEVKKCNVLCIDCHRRIHLTS